MKNHLLTILGLLAATLFMFGQAPAQAQTIPGDNIWAHRIFESDVDGYNDTIDKYMFCSYPGNALGLELDQKSNAVSGLVDSTFRFHSVGRYAWRYDGFFWADIKYNYNGEQSTTLGKLEGLNVLESGGDRVMADFVWPVLYNSTNVGRFVLRCVILHDHPTWLFAQATVYNSSNLLRLNRVWLGSYVGGYRFPGFRTRITGATGSTDFVNNLPSGILDKNTYWATAFSRTKNDPYNDTHGNMGVFLKDELAANGILWGWDENGDLNLYPLSTHATYKKNLKMAISDFHEQNVDDWLTNGFPAKATSIRSGLSAIVWDQDEPSRQAEIDRLNYQAKPIMDTMSYGNFDLASQWSNMVRILEEEMGDAEGQPIGSIDEQRWGEALTEARDWLAENLPIAYTKYTDYIREN